MTTADQVIEPVRSDVGSGSPPAGLQDARVMLMHVYRDNRKAMAIGLFESEEAIKRGDEALNDMSPNGGGQRAGVELYEVAVQRMVYGPKGGRSGAEPT